MKFLAAVSTAVLLLAGAAHAQQMKNSEMGMMNKMHADVKKAVCVLIPSENNNVQGAITFEAVEGGVKVVADVSGLTPGKHGFHIHEYGDCCGPKFKTAGSHFMAKGEKHAGPNDPDRHIGDMGNLVADAKGNAHLSLVDNKLRLSGPNSILGRAIVVHAGADDLSTQPSGDADGRAACGTIGIAE
jgi:Cu-Zn family superoxide dismutase